MTPAYLRQAREARRLTQVELAQRLGRSAQSVRNWEQGKAPIPPYVANMLAAIERLAWRAALVTAQDIQYLPDTFHDADSAVLIGSQTWPMHKRYQADLEARTIFFFMV